MGADAVGVALGKRTAKTRKGRRILERRQSQIVEDAKTALILRGNRCSSDTQALLRDLYRLRAPLAMLFCNRSHPEHPFEDIKRVESLCTKHDHSLFAFGSSSKKRPFRLILGRLFDGSLLDMQEFNVEDYKSIDSFNKSIKESVAGSKALVTFQGAAFESDERLKRAKSLLLDFFRGPTPEKVLLQGLEQVVVCSTFDSSASGGGGGASSSTPAAAAATAGAAPAIVVRRFRIDMLKSGSRLPRVELVELGPRLKLTLDRVKEPDRDRWKAAIKVPKAAKVQKVKNIKGDSLGKKRGRIHLGTQDFNQIHTVHHSKAKHKKLKADLAGRAEGGGESAPTAAGEA